MHRTVFGLIALAILANLPAGRFQAAAQTMGDASQYHASSTTCTTVEKRLVDGNRGRIGLRVLNLGPENMYVGGRDIAPARSWPVHSGTGGLVASHIFILLGSEASGELYCVADGTVGVKVFQTLK